MTATPVRLGLTGSIATGKSTVAKMFAARKIPVFSSDGVVHRLYEGPLGRNIGTLFPAALTNNGLDRARLAEIVLGDKGALDRLEKLVHPVVRAEMDRFLAEHAAKGAKLVVLDIPLLFETGHAYPLDKVAVTWCQQKEQERRVLARPGMTMKKFKAISVRQMPQAEKRALADFEIDTNQPLDTVGKQVEAIIAACTG